MKAILLLICIVPSIALGWGAEGHRTVCQIAYDEMNDRTRLEVDRLIDLDQQFATFPEACLFADGPPRIRAIDHYINVPRSFRAITTSDCPMADSCLFSALRADTKLLSNASSADAYKLLSLKLLGHWVGDLHQPLHVSFQDDRGGNFIAKRDDLNGGNIHSVWDSDIIEQRIGKNYGRIAAKLRKEITNRQRARWRFDSPVTWANESYQITISPATEYCTQQQGACWYSADNLMIDNGERKRELVVSEHYLTVHKQTIEWRLKQAGVRLAALLDAALGQ
ncbi:MAG: S1/P1 nuclease [Gammaproteobacteria bacterium]|nr:S1/P1 nuclease [Gammaproteobacteria bacterium]